VELGNDSNTASNVPVPVTGLGDVAAIATGLYHSLAVLRCSARRVLENLKPVLRLQVTALLGRMKREPRGCGYFDFGSCI
jgi:hypothetical protein